MIQKLFAPKTTDSILGSFNSTINQLSMHSGKLLEEAYNHGREVEELKALKLEKEIEGVRAATIAGKLEALLAA